MRSWLVPMAVLAACTSGSGPRLDPGQSDRSPLAVAQAQRPAAVGLEVMDLRADGAALWARPGPAPERATVLPLFEVSLVTAEGRRIELPTEGGLARDARFAPVEAGWIALLDRGDVWWLWNPADGHRIEVAGAGFPGASFSTDGDALVYAAGPWPVLELHVFDLESGVAEQLTDLGTSLALPAFTPDGGSIVFASALGGVPALWAVDRDGSHVRQLTNRDVSAEEFRTGSGVVPMPEGLRPPLCRAGEVVFEAAGGVYAVDLDGAPTWTIADADLPHLAADGELWVRTPAGARAVHEGTR